MLVTTGKVHIAKNDTEQVNEILQMQHTKIYEIWINDDKQQKMLVRILQREMTQLYETYTPHERQALMI